MHFDHLRAAAFDNGNRIRYPESNILGSTQSDFIGLESWEGKCQYQLSLTPGYVVCAHTPRQYGERNRHSCFADCRAAILASHGTHTCLWFAAAAFADWHDQAEAT